jgi:hypothetical protein
MAKRAQQGASMSQSQADARRRPQGQRKSEQQPRAMRDQQPGGREAPGPVRVDEQTDELT